MRLLQFLYSLYAFLLFAVVILLLAPIVALSMPFGRIRGANMMYDIFRVLAQSMLYLIGIHHTTRYAGPRPDPHEQYIFVANHISYLDAIVIIPSVKHHFRPIGKYELLKIPIFGFIYKFCVITVNRSNAEDRARSLDDLRKVLARGISIPRRSRPWGARSAGARRCLPAPWWRARRGTCRRRASAWPARAAGTRRAAPFRDSERRPRGSAP